MKRKDAINKDLMILIMIMSVIFSFSPQNSAYAARSGPCEKGLAVCAISCFLTGPATCACEAFCFYGYFWCQTYLEPLL